MIRRVPIPHHYLIFVSKIRNIERKRELYREYVRKYIERNESSLEFVRIEGGFAICRDKKKDDGSR